MVAIVVVVMVLCIVLVTLVMLVVVTILVMTVFTSVVMVFIMVVVVLDVRYYHMVTDSVQALPDFDIGPNFKVCIHRITMAS